MAKFVKLTINSNWGGIAPQTGLSEVRFFYVPVQAFYPQPADAATGVRLDGGWPGGPAGRRPPTWCSRRRRRAPSPMARSGQDGDRSQL